MKFSTIAVLTGAAAVQAVAVPRDYCPAVKKTVLLTWVETSVFQQGNAHANPLESAKAKFSASSTGYAAVKPSGYSSKAPYLVNPYPTGSSKPATTSTYKPTSGAPYPTGGPAYNGTTGGSTSSGSKGFTVKATSTTAAHTTTTSPPTETVQATCSNPRIRQEWSETSDSFKDAYVAGIKCLMGKPSRGSQFQGSQNLYEDFVSLHQQLTPYVHGTAQFLPWHRYFLHVYESILASECGFAGPLPFWNEANDAGAFGSAAPFTSRWFGAMPGPQGGSAVCIQEAGWGNWVVSIGPGDATQNPHCLSRAVSEDDSSQDNQGYVDLCRNTDTYDAHRDCNEHGPHAWGHNAIGGIMSDVSPSPGDPAFFLHHAYVDRNWKNWQIDAYWTRNSEINGPADSNGTPITASYILDSFGLLSSATIADVLDTEGDYLCYAYSS